MRQIDFSKENDIILNPEQVNTIDKKLIAILISSAKNFYNTGMPDLGSKWMKIVKNYYSEKQQKLKSL